MRSTKRDESTPVAAPQSAGKANGATPPPAQAPRKRAGAPKGAKTTHYVPAKKRYAALSGNWLRIEEAQALLGVSRPKMIRLLQTTLEPHVHYSLMDDRIKLLPRDVIAALARQPHERAGVSPKRAARDYDRDHMDRMREVALKGRYGRPGPRPAKAPAKAPATPSASQPA